MANLHKQTLLTTKIVQGSKVYEIIIKPNEKLTIGRSPDNDIVVYDDAYPKKHTLIECKKHSCSLNISPKMGGEIKFNDSHLNFRDLFVHDILPKKGNFYNLNFTHGRSGSIRVADADIYFDYDGIKPQPLKGLPNYKWNKSYSKSLTRDLLYKFLFLVFFSLEIVLGFVLKGIELPPVAPPDLEKVPERFAKFLIKKPAAPPPSDLVSNTGVGTNGTEEEPPEGTTKTNKPKPSVGGSGDGDSETPVVAKGLLGLIGGTGSSGNASATADFLIEQGLVKEIDQLIGNQKLIKTKGTGKNGTGSGDGIGSGAGNGLDDLLAFGMSGGIDDLLSDVEGVEKVSLQKKDNVNIQQPQQMRGSQEARAERTSESVMAVINSQQGRIMYTYNKYLREDPNLRGKISVDVTIEADGNVSNVKIVESDIENQDFIRDVINILRRLKFTPIQQGSIQVNLPFVFNRMS